MNVAIAVLSHYPDLFESFREQVDEFEPDVRKILIRDGDLIKPWALGSAWDVFDGQQPFNFSRNMNLAWKMAENSDVVIAGDDVCFSGPFVEQLQEVAYSDARIGFAVPELGGQSCFVCAYIKRHLIEEVGPMNEDFDGYGWQDNEYYRRFEALGWRTQATTAVRVIHSGATSFYRKAAEGGEDVQASCERMKQIYDQKMEQNGRL